MDESLSIENQIVLRCARRDVDLDGVGALVDRDVDWDSLLATARAHRLLPLLYEQLATLDGGRVPQEVMGYLRGAYYTNLLRNQRLEADLAEVVAALRGERVEVIVLKGGALARTVYPHPALRTMADLDLLVRMEDADRAGAVLASLGFRLPASLPAGLVPFRQRFEGGMSWKRPRGGKTTLLDLHHHPVGLHLFRSSFPVEPGALWQAARPLALKGTEALQLSTEDTLIYLCIHLALNHHYISPLLAYADIDRVIAACGQALSWPQLTERAMCFQVRTAMYISLQGAHSLLGTPVPPEVLTALQPGSVQLRVLRWLVPQDREAVLHGTRGEPGVLRRVLFYAALVDHARAVGSMVRGVLFPDMEWLTLRYPLETRHQAQLYRLVYPLHLARFHLRDPRGRLIDSSLEAGTQTTGQHR